MAAPETIGTVAIVGFPNVGKSTLVNRLTATRQAVVHETQGTTRDRKALLCEWNGQQFMLIDTGGVDIADSNPITRQIAVQARAAIREADLVLFVVDARVGVTPGDEELAQILRESKKPVLVIANKIDDPAQDAIQSMQSGSCSAPITSVPPGFGVPEPGVLAEGFALEPQPAAKTTARAAKKPTKRTEPGR